MPFCNLNKDLYNKNYTIVQNQFISQYMIDAPAVYSQIYIFGLYLCNSPDKSINTIDVFCNVLNVTQSDIIDAYTFWEDLGLVQILQSKPIEVVYIPIEDTTNILKKISPTKYSDFNKGVEAVITGRMINPSEFNEYYIFMETTFFQPEALIMVIKYCTELKGTAINYKYILAVARNLAIGGFKTLDTVEQKLTSQPLFNEGLTEVFKALKLKREIEYDDRSLFEKWTKGLGFSADVICFVAKKVKKGGITKLDKMLDNYFRLKLLDKKEIETYEQNKTELYELSIEINKILGLYYQSLDFIVEDYISPWIQKGFDAETLKLIAKYCFKHLIRALDGMDDTVDSFYKKGLVTLESIAQYFDEMKYTDQCIKTILAQMSLLRNITNTDRINYNTWTESWGFSEELLLYAASLSANAKNPMSYFTKILGNFKANNIFTVEAAETATANFKYTTATDTSTIDKKLIESQVSRQINNRKIFAEQTAQDNLNKALSDSEYKALHINRQSLTFEIAQKTYQKQDVSQLNQKLVELDNQMTDILKRISLSKDDLEPQYFCKICLDSGVVGNKRCQCFETLIAEKLSKTAPVNKPTYSVNMDALIDNLGEIEV